MRDIFNIYKITEEEVLLDLNGQEIGEEEWTIVLREENLIYVYGTELLGEITNAKFVMNGSTNKLNVMFVNHSY